MFVAVISVVVVSFAIACVSASPWASTTPLYAIRMEQASSKMSFLPTAVNSFTYTTEKGCTLTHDSSGCCGGTLLEITSGRTCEGTCIEPTCENTCPNTCSGSTCGSTCPNTCGATCDTCSSTCDTCDETCGAGSTCTYTCGISPTCGGFTCIISCIYPCG